AEEAVGDAAADEERLQEPLVAVEGEDAGGQRVVEAVELLPERGRRGRRAARHQARGALPERRHGRDDGAAPLGQIHAQHVPPLEREVDVGGIQERAVDALDGAASGERRGDARAARRADVQVEAAGRQPVHAILERRQDADLIHPAGRPPTRQAQRDLGSAHAASSCRAAAAWSLCSAMVWIMAPSPPATSQPSTIAHQGTESGELGPEMPSKSARSSAAPKPTCSATQGTTEPLVMRRWLRAPPSSSKAGQLRMSGRLSAKQSAVTSAAPSAECSRRRPPNSAPRKNSSSTKGKAQAETRIMTASSAGRSVVSSAARSASTSGGVGATCSIKSASDPAGICSASPSAKPKINSAGWVGRIPSPSVNVRSGACTRSTP